MELQSTLDTCPSLLGPYLRTFPAAMLEARPTYNLLQTYSLISVVLRKVPVAPFSLGVGEVEIGRGGRRAPDVMLSTVMPMALGKKDLTKGVLSVNSLLQVKRGCVFFAVTLLARDCRFRLRASRLLQRNNSENDCPVGLLSLKQVGARVVVGAFTFGCVGVWCFKGVFSLGYLMNDLQGETL